MIWEHNTTLIIMLCPLQGLKKVSVSSLTKIGRINSLLGRLSLVDERIWKLSIFTDICKRKVTDTRLDKEKVYFKKFEVHR